MQVVHKKASLLKHRIIASIKFFFSLCSYFVVFVFYFTKNQFLNSLKGELSLIERRRKDVRITTSTPNDVEMTILRIKKVCC